jgi:hypothetical protein
MTAAGARGGAPVGTRARRRGSRPLVLALVLLSLVIAGLLSYYASAAPDGLERVAVDHGFASLEDSIAGETSPLADYAARGVEDDRLSGALAGVTGVLLTFGIGLAVFAAARRRPGA